MLSSGKANLESGFEPNKQTKMVASEDNGNYECKQDEQGQKTVTVLYHDDVITFNYFTHVGFY